LVFLAAIRANFLKNERQMFTVIVQEKGGKTQRLQFNKSEITVGRVQGNDIVLPKGNVSKRHSKVVFKEGKFIVVDLKSTNGTYVNGHKIASPQVVKSTDKVFIGDFVLEIEEGANGEMGAPPPMPAQGPGTAPPRPMSPGGGPPPGMGGPPPGMQQRGGHQGPGPMQPSGPMQQQPRSVGGPPAMQGTPAPGARPMMGGSPGQQGSQWRETAVPGGGPPYYYLAIQGGWLIYFQNNMIFISDPNHQFIPIPS
jgi:pilus assembly protein CpaF